MIECTDKCIWYKKHRKKRFKRCFAILLVVITVFSLFLYYKNTVSNLIISVCDDYTYTYCTESVNQAVLKSLSNDLIYTDLVFVEKNDSGDIAIMSVNALKVNAIARDLVRSTANLLNEKVSKGVPVPMLAFFGIDVLSGYGNKINIKTITITNVICEFSSKFSSVGINQTLHSIYVDIKSEYVIELPFNKKNNNCVTSILISEAVLVGKVPDLYLNNGLFK